MAERLNPKYQVVLDLEQVNKYNELVGRDTPKDFGTAKAGTEIHLECPSCGEWLGRLEQLTRPKFCKTCGQRLSGQVRPEPRDIPFEEME